MSWAAELLVSVAAGVSVAAIVAAARAAWVRQRVPVALSQAVARRRYVEQILALSAHETVTSLDALSPRFAPRGDNAQIRSLQDAWAAINARGKVRVVIGNADAAISGGAELVGKGIEVRISPTFSSENLSYHIFHGDAIASTIKPGDHGTTFGGGPFVASIANYVVGRLSDPALLHVLEPTALHGRANALAACCAIEPIQLCPEVQVVEHPHFRVQRRGLRNRRRSGHRSRGACCAWVFSANTHETKHYRVGCTRSRRAGAHVTMLAEVQSISDFR